jgi:hypothetical protein
VVFQCFVSFFSLLWEDSPFSLSCSFPLIDDRQGYIQPLSYMHVLLHQTDSDNKLMSEKSKSVEKNPITSV